MKINNFQLMTELHCRHGENRENEDTCSVIEGVRNSKFQKYISYEITYLNIIFLCLVVYYIIWWYHLILQLFSTGTLLVFLLPVKLQDHKKIIITGGKYYNQLKAFSNNKLWLSWQSKELKQSTILFAGDASYIFASMVFCGFLFLSLVQAIGVLFGDKAPTQVLWKISFVINFTFNSTIRVK